MDPDSSDSSLSSSKSSSKSNSSISSELLREARKWVFNKNKKTNKKRKEPKLKFGGSFSNSDLFDMFSLTLRIYKQQRSKLVMV